MYNGDVAVNDDGTVNEINGVNTLSVGDIVPREDGVNGEGVKGEDVNGGEGVNWNEGVPEMLSEWMEVRFVSGKEENGKDRKLEGKISAVGHRVRLNGQLEFVPDEDGSLAEVETTDGDLMYVRKDEIRGWRLADSGQTGAPAGRIAVSEEAVEDLSDGGEVDENGLPFVKTPDGNTIFGEIREESGLAAAPIKLSEGYQGEDG